MQDEILSYDGCEYVARVEYWWREVEVEMEEEQEDLVGGTLNLGDFDVKRI